MKKILSLQLIFFVGFLFSQDDISVEKSNYEIQSITHDINELLHYSISNLPDDEIIIQLKEKLDSELNNVVSCALYFKYADALSLSEKNQSALIERMKLIADGFIKNGKYVFFERSGGYAPIVGIKGDSIANKKVLKVMLGGDCTVTKTDIKEREIYEIFNERIKESIEK